MFNVYDDITQRIAEPPKWWDEQGVPRYVDYSHYAIWNIYARETALVEIACQWCWSRFEVAFSIPGTGFQDMIGNCKTIAEAIEKGDLHYGDPPNYGNCQPGASMGCYDLRVLQYWSRPPVGHWIRDSRLEIDLPDKRELDRLHVERMICSFRDLRKL